ncbi:MAG: hypothetical protein M9915_02760 [Rhizobacter sp.]|nr:hypothetical protein [Rhizobacter sp.]
MIALVTLFIWAAFALWALVWTAFAVAGSALIHWGAGLLASGEAAQPGRTVASLPLPPWLARRVDVETRHAMRDGIVRALESAQQALPRLGSLLQWLLALTWLLWAVGIGLILLPAFGAQLLLRRFSRRAPLAAA